MFKVNYKNTRMTSMASSWGFYLLTLAAYFAPFSKVYFSDFEQLNVSWVPSNEAKDQFFYRI